MIYIFQNINDVDNYTQLYYKLLERKTYVKSLSRSLFFHNGCIVN